MERYKFFSEMSSNELVGWAFICTVLLAVSVGIGFLSMRTPPTLDAQEVKAEEEVLTVNMVPSVLMGALEENANDWCDVSRTIPLIGDVVICSRTGDTGAQIFDIMMLTDSMAPKMADEFPHLFEYKEKNGIKSFKMSANAQSVTVPVWLVKLLIDKDILKLPDDKSDQ